MKKPSFMDGLPFSSLHLIIDDLPINFPIPSIKNFRGYFPASIKMGTNG
jgi:hypothetical protein